MLAGVTLQGCGGSEGGRVRVSTGVEGLLYRQPLRLEVHVLGHAGGVDISGGSLPLVHPYIP